jgi:hypothetical protein
MDRVLDEQVEAVDACVEIPMVGTGASLDVDVDVDVDVARASGCTPSRHGPTGTRAAYAASPSL